MILRAQRNAGNLTDSPFVRQRQGPRSFDRVRGRTLTRQKARKSQGGEESVFHGACQYMSNCIDTKRRRAEYGER